MRFIEEHGLVGVGGVREPEVSMRINLPHGLFHFEVTQVVVGGEKEIVPNSALLVAHLKVANETGDAAELPLVEAAKPFYSVAALTGDLQSLISPECVDDVLDDRIVWML